MQKKLRFLTIGAFFITTPVLADVPVPAIASVRWNTEGAGPLASRFISQPIVRAGKATLSFWQSSGTRTVVVLNPDATPNNKRSASRLPRK